MTKSREKFFRFIMIGLTCLFFGVESTKPITDVVFSNFRSPPARPMFGVNALERRSFPLDSISISVILRSSTKPKIMASIVKSIPVFMVNLLTGTGLHYNTVRI